MTTEAKGVKEKIQRIKLRMYKHPVKHDGSIIEWAKDGKSFVVRFDGPLPDTRFWAYGETHVTDKEPIKYSANTNEQLAEGSTLWEVL